MENWVSSLISGVIYTRINLSWNRWLVLILVSVFCCCFFCLFVFYIKACLILPVPMWWWQIICDKAVRYCLNDTSIRYFWSTSVLLNIEVLTLQYYTSIIKGLPERKTSSWTVSGSMKLRMELQFCHSRLLWGGTSCSCLA